MKMIGYVLLGMSLIGANIIGYDIYSKRKAEKIREKYRDINGNVKTDMVITLKPEDIKVVN